MSFLGKEITENSNNVGLGLGLGLGLGNIFNFIYSKFRYQLRTLHAFKVIYNRCVSE